MTDEVGLLWLVEELTEGPPEPDPTEVLRRRRLPLAEAAGMAARGDLTDSLTVAGLLRAARLVAGRRAATGP